MKSKARAIHLVLEMAENRANACQVPGHSPLAREIPSALRVNRPC